MKTTTTITTREVHAASYLPEGYYAVVRRHIGGIIYRRFVDHTGRLSPLVSYYRNDLQARFLLATGQQTFEPDPMELIDNRE